MNNCPFVIIFRNFVIAHFLIMTQVHLTLTVTIELFATFPQTIPLSYSQKHFFALYYL